MERRYQNDRFPKGTFLALLAMGAIFVWADTGVNAASGHKGSESTTELATKAFEKEYTEVGGCLHNTSYNPNSVSINLHFNHKLGEQILSVTSAVKALHEPQTLSFEWQDGHLVDANSATANLLFEIGCK